MLSSLLAVAWTDGGEYIVKKGDTLYSIAKTYGISVDTLMKANGIGDARTVKIGMKLVIPGSYKIGKGETWYSIAKAHGCTVEELQALNGVKTGSVLKLGQTIIVPSKLAAVPATLPSKDSGATSPIPASAVVDGGKTVSWPCEGDKRYLTGKVYGVLINVKEKSQARCVASGTVIAASLFQGYGMVVFVQSKTGYLYVYGGNESVNVKVGDRLVSGVPVGTIGVDMKEKTPTAYFFVFFKGKPMDPAKAPRD